MTALLLPVTVETLGVATTMVLSFIGLLFVGALVLPGLERPGPVLPNGDAKDYKLYGMALFFLLHVVLGIAFFGFHLSLTPIVQHFWSLLILANIVAGVWALALYVYGKRGGSVL